MPAINAPSPANRSPRTVSARLALLARLPFFAELDASILADIQAWLQPLSLQRGEFALEEGEASDRLFLVASGRLKLLRTSAGGKEHILRLLHPGDTFNEVSVFDAGPAPATAVALEPARLYALSQKDLSELMTRHPAIARVAVRRLALQMRQLVSMVEDLSFKQVSGRLAKLLLTQAAAGQTQGAQVERLTQQDMASMIGTAREVVARALRSMEEQGLIRLENRRVVIINRAVLEELA
jgi:CRP/FNR family transcriptional regulator, cyclic AMP receptor protein